MSKKGYNKTFTGMLQAPDGVCRWFVNGAYGREDDLPAVVYPDGSSFWYMENPRRGQFGQQHSIPHRVGGPAVIKADGTRIYYELGQLHRTVDEGPAIEYPDGECGYWVNGKHVRTERKS